MKTTEKALELCHAIEAAGASEELTKCSVIASDLRCEISHLETLKLAAEQKLGICLRALDLLRRDSKSPDFVKVYCALIEDNIKEWPNDQSSPTAAGRKDNP